MYREFYGMKHQPFSRNVPSEALYESKAMTEALGRLAYVADRLNILMRQSRLSSLD